MHLGVFWTLTKIGSELCQNWFVQLDQIWTRNNPNLIRTGPKLNQILIIIGSKLDQLYWDWARAGQALDQNLDENWTKTGPKLIMNWISILTDPRQTWIRTGPAIDQNRSKTGPELMNKLTRSGPKLNKKRTRLGTNLDQNLIKTGPEQDQKWTRSGSELDQNWTRIRLELLRAIRSGPELDQNWVGTGPEFDLHERLHFKTLLNLKKRIFKSFPFCLILLANRFVFLAIFFIGLIVFRILLIENRN